MNSFNIANINSDKSITGSYMCCMTSNELPDKARGHKITQLINLYQVKATSPTPKYLY